jgi:hypothetical protein
METYWLVGKGRSASALIERVPSTPSTVPLVVDEDEAVSPHIFANPAVEITRMNKNRGSPTGELPLYADYLDMTKSGN